MLSVFECYINDRQQSVKMESVPLNMKIGTPQGTVLEPILLIYEIYGH